MSQFTRCCKKLAYNLSYLALRRNGISKIIQYRIKPAKGGECINEKCITNEKP